MVNYPVDDLLADIKSVIELVTTADRTRPCDENAVFALLESRIDLPRPDRVREVATDILVGYVPSPTGSGLVTRGSGLVNPATVCNLGSQVLDEIDMVLTWFPDTDPNEVYQMLEKHRGPDSGSVGVGAVHAVLQELADKSDNMTSRKVDSDSQEPGE